MGLFDKLAKLGSDLAKSEITKTLKEEINKVVPDEIKNATNSSRYSIPSEYSSFPAYEGPIGNLSTKDEVAYKRCTIDYYNVSTTDYDMYVSKVRSNGYDMATKVRYDKDNTYIILEMRSNQMHVVFHIKK